MWAGHPCRKGYHGQKHDIATTEEKEDDLEPQALLRVPTIHKTTPCEKQALQDEQSRILDGLW